MLKIPKNRPKLTQEDLHKILEPYKIDRAKYPLIIIGIRGYYRDSMGKPGLNDRGIYDDAIFLDTPNAFVSFNANTDPSVYRPGIAVLKPNVIYYAHRFDVHRGKKSQYDAICQRAGNVTVIRDGGKECTGDDFGINIHRGGDGTTGSEGCQTIPPDQWGIFYAAAQSEAKMLFGKDWRQRVVPYGVLEGVV
jgi:hypothetical protein